MAERSYLGETYTSLRATPELVGRRGEQSQIEEALCDPQQRTYVVYIHGPGGIGKTFLIRHLLERWGQSLPRGLPKGCRLQVSVDLVDLYHTRNHTVEGLMQAVQRALSPEGRGFENYLRERAKLEEFLVRPPEQQEAIGEQRKRVRRTFMEDLERLSEGRRIVLALDTAERLFYREDLAAARLKRELKEEWEEKPSILHWLLHEFFPRLRNTVVLLAGRPGPGTLERDLKKSAGDRFEVVSIPLQGLTEDEAAAYFDAVAKAAEKEGDLLVSEYLNGLTEDAKRAVFHCLRDGGRVRPILLALALDHLVVAGLPLEELTLPVEKARSLGPDGRRRIREKLLERVVAMLHERRRPADEIILALGWLRKGASTDLLLQATGLPKEEIERGIEQVRALSFVKVRPADERLFLHDEMYDFLQPFVQKSPPPAQERWFNAVTTYYRMSIDKWRARVADLYRPVGREVLPPLQVAHEIEEALVRIREAMIEDLYYRLCRDPARGFQTYFRYAEEAISTNDESLDLLLRAELLGFLAERVPQEERDTWNEIDGLRRADLIADAAVRWIKRYIAEGKNKQALRIAECLGEDGGAADLIASGDDLARAERDVWWALAKVYSGAFEEAGEKLSRIIENLEQVDQDLRTARWAGIMARAYNNRGYLRRVQGRYLGAVSDYEKAVILWRAAEIESELANTLNNLAFAKAEVGLFGTAWRIGQEALRRREEMGPRVPVGLSLNTLAHIAVRDDKPVTARRYAARALRLFRSLEHRRGEGLARVIFSEACRRWAERLNEVEWMLGALKVCYGVEFKRQSGENASVENVATIWNEVVDLLDQEEEGKVQGPHLLLDEPDRQVEALIELGCVYRDLLRFLMQSLHQGDLVPRLAEDLIRGLERKSIGERLLTREEVERNLNEAIERIKQRLVDKGEKALRQAAEIAAAREGIRYRQMEALVNLAWLYYYLDPLQRGEKRVEKILEEAEKVRPGEYVVSRLMESRPKDDQIVFPFLVQSGKAELLRGQIAFNQYWEGERGEGDLKKAVERYLLSLAYDAMLFPHSFRDMRRGMDRIYERLSQLQHRDLHRVWEWTKEFEQQYSLKNWVLDERTGEKGSRFRRFLLDSFGPPERLYEIVER